MTRSKAYEEVKDMLNKIYSELSEVKIQTTKTNGRVNRAEKDIVELKKDNCKVWEVINDKNTENAKQTGRLYEWEKGMEEFKKELRDEVKRTIDVQTPDYRLSILGNVGTSGITGILLVIILKLIGVF